MADLRRTDPGHFVDEVSRIIDTLGSVLLVHASSFFNEPHVRLRHPRRRRRHPR
jgi:hypothetical protein